MFISPRILLAGAASLLTLAACNSGDALKGTASGKDAIAATVNGIPISERVVSLMVKQRVDLGRPGSAEARNAFIDRLAMQVILAQEAVKKGLDKAPEVSDRIELGRQSILADAFIQDHLKNHPVSDDALKAEYEKLKADSAGSEYKARHILVEREADAKDIIARLKKTPKAFDVLARERSKDPGSRSKGGDLGWFDPRRMVPEFGAALAALAKGKFTLDPVKSQFGYHVILLEDSRPKQVQPLEHVKPALTQQLQQQSLKKTMDDLKAKAKIEIVQAPVSAPASEAKPAQSTGK